MPEPSVVPRPDAPGDGSTPWERARALRGDVRVGAAVLACVALAAGVAWFRSGIAPASPAPAPGTSASASGGSSGGRRVVERVGDRRHHDLGRRDLDDDRLDRRRCGRRGARAGSGHVARVARACSTRSAPPAGRARAPTSRASTSRRSLPTDRAVAVPLVGQPPPSVDPSAVSGGAPSGDGSDTSTGGSTGGAPPRRST